MNLTILTDPLSFISVDKFAADVKILSMLENYLQDLQITVGKFLFESYD